MRIISGIWKGKSITSPSEGTRPSTDKTRQALFNILHHLVEDAVVLDLFSGSGALGLECLSRGAKEATAVELDRRSATVIKKNAQALGANGLIIQQSDVREYLDRPTKAQVDLIFADPPYDDNFADSALLATLNHPSWHLRAHSDTYFIAESPQDLTKTDLLPSHWDVVTNRQYGKCHITILKFRPCP